MSGKDDPFGSGGKTVIRPNPAGRPRPDTPRPPPDFSGESNATVIGGPVNPPPRPASPVPPPPAHAPPQAPPPAYAPVAPPPAYAPAPGAPPPASRQIWGTPGSPSFQSPMPKASETARYAMPDQDDWMRASSNQAFFPGAQPPPQPIAAQEKIPLDVALNARDGGEYSAANPITAAAAPLLILLGRLRLMIIDMQAVPLMTHVAQEIREFEKKAGEAGVPPEDIQVAKYALCGTADDIVQNLPGTDRHVWMQYSMLAQFFGVRTSGVGFFEELKKILANPAPRYNLLELMHACLSLGFEGQYRGAAGGDSDLQRWRRDAYQTLRHLRTRNDDDISPHWRGLAKLARKLGDSIPVWVIAGVVGAALVGVFFILRFIISNDGDALANRLIALNPSDPVTIERAAFKPFVGPDLTQTTQLQRIRNALADDIAAGGLGVDPVGDNIVIAVSNLLLFASGKADVKPEFQPIAQRIAQALDKEPGQIHVTGHTDNVKPRASGPFKSNYDLSVARAKSVEAVLAPNLANPARLTVAGKGEDEPVADNKTPEGRAKNRRVEVMIPKAPE